MYKKYTDNVNQQILISLLKAYGIKKVIASPGGTNPAFIASLQYDGNFEIYSCVDERSAAYMACGLCEEIGEPVIICCTGATASRNYMPALTEAYYRKLPILAITGTHGNDVTGHLNAQSIDRSQTPNDTVNYNISVGKIKDKDDEWLTIVNVNKALSELSRNGGGPVLINMHEATGAGFDTKELPCVRKIDRILLNDSLPEISCDLNSVAIFVGSHKDFTKAETFFCIFICHICYFF